MTSGKKGTLLRSAGDHPNVTIVVGLVLAWGLWLWGSAKYSTYRYEQDWLLIQPPPKSVSDLQPDLTAAPAEWTIETVCPSWSACQRFLKASRGCANMDPNNSGLQESVLAEKCIARADPAGPLERSDPQPAFDGCDPDLTFAPKNCEPRRAVSQ